MTKLIYSLLLVPFLATATLLPTTYNGLSDSGDELWTLTDFNANLDDSNVELVMRKGQNNTFDHEFGFYLYDAPTDLIADSLKIFDSTMAIGDDSNIVWNKHDETARTRFGTMDLSLSSALDFGFYFKSDGRKYYSQSQFNGGADRFAFFWETDPFANANLYVLADDGGPHGAYDYIEVEVNDVSRLPVPEPGILMLMGLGLLGISVLKRAK